MKRWHSPESERIRKRRKKIFQTFRSSPDDIPACNHNDHLFGIGHCGNAGCSMCACQREEKRLRKKRERLKKREVIEEQLGETDDTRLV